MADKTPTILVPVGFSEQSIIALDQAVVFAKAMNAQITMLTVIEETKDFRKIFGTKKKGKELKTIVKQKLNALCEEFANKSGLKINTMTATGVVYEEISRVTDMIDADLVIMGTNGRPQNLRKRFIGSNAYRTATLVSPPVITIKGVRNPDKVDTIIFPLVLDRRSKEKVGAALKYARLFNSRIKIVSVLQENEDPKILNGHIKQVEKFIKDHGVECTAELIKPKEKGIVRNTLDYANQNDGDLIIITEDDKDRDFTDLFLGTDVQSMIYHSEIPVMCITSSEIKWRAMWEGI